MMQNDKPKDYVLATGEAHSVKEFATIAARTMGFDLISTNHLLNFQELFVLNTLNNL